MSQLPEPYIKVLLALIGVAERNQSWLLAYSWQQDPKMARGFTLKIMDQSKGEYITVPKLEEDVIETLRMLGFVECPKEKTVFLHYEKAKKAIVSNSESLSDIDDTESLRKQLRQRQDNLNWLNEQEAKYGPDLYRKNRIEDEENEIARLKAELERDSSNRPPPPTKAPDQ